jgi:hypothetical protein
MNGVRELCQKPPQRKRQSVLLQPAINVTLLLPFRYLISVNIPLWALATRGFSFMAAQAIKSAAQISSD